MEQRLATFGKREWGQKKKKYSRCKVEFMLIAGVAMETDRKIMEGISAGWMELQSGEKIKKFRWYS